MEAEPLYIFKPGQGWVPQSNTSNIVTLKCGTRVRLENRTPKKDERYDAGMVSELWGSQDEPNWQVWKDHFSGYTLVRLCRARNDIIHRRGDVYIVAVLL